MTVMTLGQRSAETGGRPSGFDYLRIILALMVALDHIPYLTYTTDVAAGFIAKTHLAPLVAAILPMFFALSGFLVAGSLERCRTTRAFLGLRMIRIFPALGVEVILSALILGPLLTTLPLAAYFAAPEFRHYFLNVAGDIHFQLPGVFQSGTRSAMVNGQLWTIPYELLCYLLLTLLAFAGVRRWPALAPVAAIGSTLAYALAVGVQHHWDVAAIVPGAMTLRDGLAMVWAFLWGVTLNAYRDRVPWSRAVFIVCAVAAGVSLMIGGYLLYIAPPLLAYCTVYLGLTNFKRAWFLRGADYSYGVYLYHYVIMQTVMTFAPHHWLTHILISLPLAIAFAAFSWHLIEKPAMNMRHPLMAADRGSGPRTSLQVSGAVSISLLVFVALLHAVRFLAR